jgi:hypothetical protein
MPPVPTPDPAPAKPPAADVNGQLITAVLIVLVLGGLGGGMLYVGAQLKDLKEVGLGLGTIIGALANALTSPSGIASVLRASQPAPPPAG